MQRLPKIVNVGHHDSHAAIFFVSPFEEASMLVIDGYGDDAATSTFTGAAIASSGTGTAGFFDSIGMIYTLVTSHLGFQPVRGGHGDGAGGLRRHHFRRTHARRCAPRAGRGASRSTWTISATTSTACCRPFKRRFIEAFGPPRAPGETLTDRHRDVARALQAVTEEVVLHVARHLAATYPSRNLVLTGGVALNCVANARILRDTDFRRVWVPPCASDTGAPLGSALWHYHQTLGQPREFEMTHAFYGRPTARTRCAAHWWPPGSRSRSSTRPSCCAASPATSPKTASSAGSRAASRWARARSATARSWPSPLRREMRDLINARIKYREPFRPFAPAVLVEYAADYFEISQPDPFMTLAPRVRPDKVDVIPAAVHVDGTGRIQTVERPSNPRYYGVIEEFRKLTGVPVLLNTSFNKQEPIVARPEEAISCFLRTEMDTLVLGNFYTRDRPPAAVARARNAFTVLDAEYAGWGVGSPKSIGKGCPLAYDPCLEWSPTDRPSSALQRFVRLQRYLYRRHDRPSRRAFDPFRSQERERSGARATAIARPVGFLRPGAESWRIETLGEAVIDRHQDLPHLYMATLSHRSRARPSATFSSQDKAPCSRAI